MGWIIGLDPPESPPVLEGPLFGDLPAQARTDFLRPLAHKAADEGTILYYQGDPSDTIWIVLSGEISLLGETEAEESVELDRARPGDAFGEVGVLSHTGRRLTAKADTPVHLRALRRERFELLLDQRDPCAEALLRYLAWRVCRRLRQANLRIELSNDVRSKVDPHAVARQIGELDKLVEYP